WTTPLSNSRRTTAQLSGPRRFARWPAASLTWRHAPFARVLLSGLYLLLAAIAAHGLGGYLPGLMGARPAAPENTDVRDGMHGLLALALATLLTAVIGLATA